MQIYLQRIYLLQPIGILILLSLGLVAKEYPNVIYILADDLGYGELGSYGQEKIKTPHLDQLAQDGMRFTQHYSGAPVYAPSRGVLFTGQHLSKTALRGNKQSRKDNGQPFPAMNLVSVFKDQGYATGAFGKWGMGFIGTYDEFGFDQFFGYKNQARAHTFYPDFLWNNDEKVFINDPAVPGHLKRGVDADFDFSQLHGQTYAPHLILEKALNFIRDHQDQPFFAYMPFIEPHLAMHPPQSSVDEYPVEWDEPQEHYRAAYLPHPRPRAGYAAMISDLDHYVGQIVALLEELGLRENTLILFSSDNGTTMMKQVDRAFFDSTAGLRGTKTDLYEGGIRVPMIASWPGKIPANTVSDHASGFVDVLATACDLLGIEPHESVDGVSFLPELLGAEQPLQPVLAWEFDHTSNDQQAIILDGRWRGIRRNLDKDGSVDGPSMGWEVYDLDTDPRESNDLAQSMPELTQRIHNAMMANRTDSSEFPIPNATR